MDYKDEGWIAYMAVARLPSIGGITVHSQLRTILCPLGIHSKIRPEFWGEAVKVKVGQFIHNTIRVCLFLCNKGSRGMKQKYVVNFIFIYIYNVVHTSIAMIAYPLTQDILCLGSHSSKPNLFHMKCVESTTL